MADVFRSDQTGEWSKTSVSMRPETRRRLKTYAAAHDMRTGQQEAEQRQIDPWSAQPPQRRGHGR